MPHLEIAKFCETALVSRKDGERVRHAIEAAWNGEQLVLDFSNVTIASVSFFDEALGLLAKQYPLDELTKRVRVQNMVKADRALLNNIVLARSKERSVPSESSRPPD